MESAIVASSPADAPTIRPVHRLAGSRPLLAPGGATIHARIAAGKKGGRDMTRESSEFVGIRATIEYLRTEFPNDRVGHLRVVRSLDEQTHEHLFYVGLDRREASHRLLLCSQTLENTLPLNLITTLQNADVARKLREAGPKPLRPDLPDLAA